MYALKKMAEYHGDTTDTHEGKHRGNWQKVSGPLRSKGIN